ncbi:uncharacterized protein LOC131682950 isoform X4 [Topomyia yanbarensis]|uniref:uncharacterized protein LOC131682950 isoform X4 n=1 Tax=Topomyia yanbarensis TaxID=2498891 RepID=UPI00273C9346|nr:uncharacterized protein LOC131682950 isoform X4 [Topomyia yanbarensis]XP_058820743.1 uncharacterized protein LOC131682950 isoform X4 [Topomyia yanbarensis]
MRPNTLNLRHQQNHDVSRGVLRETYRAWADRSEECIVPEKNIRSLFQQLKLFPTTEQVHDMIRTARLIAQGSNNCTKYSKHSSGLTFGEFSVLFADIRKLGYASILNNIDVSHPVSPSSSEFSSKVASSNTNKRFDEQSSETTVGPEVFLGGSCNPTTWRADVAIPTLNHLGISFYNPQVSEWTPDLLELEHRAKEKAKVLFFVMDSQTRSTAGAIEVAHIAGRNSKHLVLVLLPYKPNQKILNEQLTMDEYVDLSRNQLLLKQLVRRRGLPVLDSIPLALEYIKNILSGGSCREHPQNIATRLISVRRTYDRVASNSHYAISLSQCQKALMALGYSPGIASIPTIKQVLAYYEHICHQESKCGNRSSPIMVINAANGTAHIVDDKVLITFDGLCILDFYFAVLHHEILETSCISPIKGTNLQQPPIYLTDSPECSHRFPSSPINSSKMFTVEENDLTDQRQNTPESYSICFNNKIASGAQYKCGESSNTDAMISTTAVKFIENTFHNTVNKSCTHEYGVSSDWNYLELASLNFPQNTRKGNFHLQNDTDESFHHDERLTLKIRDIYLGGSCWMLTNWRQQYAAPYLKANNITFYMSSFHEGLEGTSSTGEIYDKNVYRDHQLIFNPALLDSSRILLFVITNDTRSLGAMTMAAHYIGMGYNVVMCVQMLTDGCTVKGSQLSSSAVRDYNRGRTYLIDLSKRQGIPVFGEIEAALDCAVEKLRVQCNFSTETSTSSFNRKLYISIGSSECSWCYTGVSATTKKTS